MKTASRLQPVLGVPCSPSFVDATCTTLARPGRAYPVPGPRDRRDSSDCGKFCELRCAMPTTSSAAPVSGHRRCPGTGRGGVRYSRTASRESINVRPRIGPATPRSSRRCSVPDLTQTRKLAEIPFDFVRKRVSVVIQTAGGVRLVTKGAFAQLLSVCATTADGTVLTPDVRSLLDDRHAAWTAQGIRVLAVAVRNIMSCSSSRPYEARSFIDAGVSRLAHGDISDGNLPTPSGMLRRRDAEAVQRGAGSFYAARAARDSRGRRIDGDQPIRPNYSPGINTLAPLDVSGPWRTGRHAALRGAAA